MCVGCKVGAYVVNVASFEALALPTIAVPAPSAAADQDSQEPIVVVVIDEVGPWSRQSGLESRCPAPQTHPLKAACYPFNDPIPDPRGLLGQVGKMELFSESFKDRVTACLDHPRVLVLGEGGRGRTQHKLGTG